MKKILALSAMGMMLVAGGCGSSKKPTAANNVNDIAPPPPTATGSGRMRLSRVAAISCFRCRAQGSYESSYGRSKVLDTRDANAHFVARTTTREVRSGDR